MEILSSIAGSMVEIVTGRLFDAVGRQLGYLCHHNENIQALAKQAKKLAAARDSIQMKIDDAKRNRAIILADVQNWISEADNTSAQVENFFEEEVTANKKCFRGWCINLKSCYRFSKVAKKHTLAISNQLQEAEKFENVSCPAPPPGIIISSSKLFSDTFKSRQSIMKQTMEALTDENVSTIGIYGMGGVGKTTLVKEIIKHAKEAKLYDAVVMTAVSQTPNILKIQGDIAYMLGLTLPDESKSPRACCLWDRIKNEKRILVILDDVWSRIELSEIGIGDGHPGCKILLTSRIKNVCDQMDCNKTFAVATLLPEESWDLFKKLADIDDKNSDKSSMAKKVAAKCGGLPIAIVTVARALKKQNHPVWEDAMQQLEMSTPANIEGLDKNMISSLELSFNYLKPDAKSLLLFCSLFPEDFSIPIEVLVRYGIGMKWFEDDLDKMVALRVKTNAVVSNLISNFLLIAGDGYYKHCVKMHDIIRDVALVVAHKCKQVFMAKGGIGLKEWPDRVTFEHFTCISLMANNIKHLPDGLECPQLQALLLKDNSNLVVPNNFFQGMKDLKLLDLESANLCPLPESFPFLTNLRALNLSGCKLGDLSAVGRISKLEILSLSRSDIEEIPISFSQLSNLRLLDLKDCWNLTLISGGVLSSLTKLEELYIDSFKEWDFESGNLRSNASFVELKALLQLTSLQITIQNSDLLPNDMSFQSLSNFILQIGCNIEFEWEASRFLKNIMLWDMKISKIHDWVRSLLKRTENLYLNKIGNLDNISYDLVEEGFENLKSLSVRSCEIKYLLNTLEWTPNLTFYKLEQLAISENPNLVEICRGQSLTQDFSRLKLLNVSQCNNMLNIVPSHLLSRFQNLKTLKAENCESLVYIFDCEVLEIANGETKLLSSLEYLELRDLPQMSHIWKSKHQLISLHNLKRVELYSCEKLIKLFSQALLQSLICLKVIDIENCNKLEEIFEKKQAEDQEREAEIHNKLDHNTTSTSLGNLTSIEIMDCDNLKTIFTSSIVKNLIKLKSLSVWHCSTIEEIVTNDEGEEGASTKRMVFPSLYCIELDGLSELTCFSSGSYSIEYPALKILNIYKCPKMKTFGYADQVTPKLEQVYPKSGEPRWDGSLNATVQQLFNDQ